MRVALVNYDKVRSQIIQRKGDNNHELHYALTPDLTIRPLPMATSGKFEKS